MAGIPLPALDVRPPQAPPNQLDQLGQILGLRNAIQNAPLQHQILQQQQQSGQLGIQAAQLGIQTAQQNLDARQALNAAFAGAVTKDGNGQPTFDEGKLIQNLSRGPAAYQSPAVAKGITDFQKSRLDLQSSAVDLQSKTGKMIGSAASAIKAAGYDPTLAHSLLDSLPQSPQLNTLRAQIDNPQALHHLVDQAIANSPDAVTQAVDVAEKQAQTKAAESTAAKNNLEIQNGGPLTDEGRFISNYLKAKGLSNTPANQLAAQQEYNRETRIQPALERVNAYANTHEYPVIDTANGNRLVYASAADINSANTATPGRFAPAAQGDKALGKTALIEDIRGNLTSVRQSLSDPKMPEFTAGQRAAIALALGGPDPGGALTAAFRGGVLGTLAPQQQSYLVSLAQLKENAMAMRSVLGAGQGSDDLRAAISATIPGPRTPSKQYGLMQLNAFEKVLNRLEQGVPSVPLAGQGGRGSSQPNPGGNGKPDPFAQFGGAAH